MDVVKDEMMVLVDIVMLRCIYDVSVWNISGGVILLRNKVRIVVNKREEMLVV